MWVVAYLPEIESDFSRFHRIDDPVGTMDSPRFFRMARLLHTYGGAVMHAIRADVIEFEREKERIEPAPAGAEIKALIAQADHAPSPGLPGIEYRGK